MSEQVIFIPAVQLIVLRKAVKLESLGMTRSRRPSATQVARELLCLKKSTPRKEVLVYLNYLYDQLMEEVKSHAKNQQAADIATGVCELVKHTNA